MAKDSQPCVDINFSTGGTAFHFLAYTLGTCKHIMFSYPIQPLHNPATTALTHCTAI